MDAAMCATARARSTYGNKEHLSEISDVQRFIELFEKKGYLVIREHGLKDIGIDIIAKKNTHTILCQVKTGRRSITDSQIIHQTNNSFLKYIDSSRLDSIEKWLVSNSSYPMTARKIAQDMNFKLIKTRNIELEITKLDEKYRELNRIKELYEKFLLLSDFTAGEGLIEKSLNSWLDERRRAKAHYSTIFHKNNIQQMRKEDFRGFLYFRNNRSWTSLYRQGLRLVDKLEAVKAAITHLQDESAEIEDRVNAVLRGGDLSVKGFGKNTATGILHIVDETDSYGVWNNVTEIGLRLLNRKPRLSSTNFGKSYTRINTELLKLKKELDTDLVMIDSFMWYLVKYHSSN